MPINSTSNNTPRETAPKAKFTPVILAGGSGTRFWPRSRRASAKQVLCLEGDQTMIQQTLSRLALLSSPADTWIVTNSLLADTIAAQLPEVSAEHIISEPVARNTAPAAALIAFLLEASEPETVLGMFPADHVISDTDRFRQVVESGVRLASAGDNIVVLGVTPTRPETGYGYIEHGREHAPVITSDGKETRVSGVRRFREKPDRHTAERFLESGTFTWNSGMFFWKVRTLTTAVREHAPDLAAVLDRIAASYGTEKFHTVLAAEYPLCENISIDYAFLEPRAAKGEARSNIVCLPADFGWNDLGSWSSLHEHLGVSDAANVIDGETKGLTTISSSGNYVYAPGKLVALLGVQDLVVVQTEDAILITTKAHAQDVSKVVRLVHEQGKTQYL